MQAIRGKLRRTLEENRASAAERAKITLSARRWFLLFVTA
ncbi:hypothetical protein EHW99_2891 [Erwinia amylovora]|uniref:Uncharacterized protein n=3 Tax=Erwinia amylovora TaxID=552 RepID=A0A831ERA9_ERWAM|nr:hypothetical protein EaACW_0694 [Erwinia amylovora ACW56400]QJQ55590.1 hypothetical protein EHX00_2891 [Erwinia amylovora]CBA19637.1 hypothetical protein predicted by Glimmer/Critica [Erwinia amylovora CFBP1430]CBX79531.1 hypothetical protein predicted by Glimmer/Critica [Erwinia amylovora ATCC BAA-2158]CCO77542.1 hypothetical protein BN432_0711 [Erwinia amylovora Ea356]CCO81326.1 hypothetical protein BN433_0721 [Erwinia amylovora Ea266]CCO85130.1 hypothetical protein BN434_0709 [Erwinia a